MKLDASITFKSGCWAGARHLTRCVYLLVTFCDRRRTSRDRSLLQLINKTWVIGTLTKHNWTNKNVSFKQQPKFSTKISCNKSTNCFCVENVTRFRFVLKKLVFTVCRCHKTHTTGYLLNTWMNHISPAEVKRSLACTSFLTDWFSTQSEFRKQRGWAPAGTTPIVVNNDSLVDHYAVTLMVGFHAPPS
jgi:hypothetical protein